jgi:hypothetical protein
VIGPVLAGNADKKKATRPPSLSGIETFVALVIMCRFATSAKRCIAFYDLD